MFYFNKYKSLLKTYVLSFIVKLMERNTNLNDYLIKTFRLKLLIYLDNAKQFFQSIMMTIKTLIKYLEQCPYFYLSLTCLYLSHLSICIYIYLLFQRLGYHGQNASRYQGYYSLSLSPNMLARMFHLSKCLSESSNPSYVDSTFVI